MRAIFHRCCRRWRALRSVLWLGLALMFAACGAPPTSVAQTTGAKPFVVVQSMHYAGPVNSKGDSPDLSAFGVPRSPIVYEAGLWPPGAPHDEPPSADALRQRAANWSAGPLPTVIDIERWSLYADDPTLRAENLRKLSAVIDTLHQVRPDLTFGYYGVLPERRYWELIDPHKASARQAWEAANRRATEDFAGHVDAVFPSLYTFYNRPQEWVTYATAMLQAARATGKPVYAYLWPRFHEGGDKALAGQYLPPGYWRLELETVRRYADGVVIWNSEKNPWGPQAPWWLATVDFLHALQQ